MPIEKTRVVTIILEECSTVEERCEGYRDMISDVLSQILQYENQHRIQGTRIQQQITDQIGAAGHFLSQKMNEGD